MPEGWVTMSYYQLDATISQTRMGRMDLRAAMALTGHQGQQGHPPISAVFSDREMGRMEATVSTVLAAEGVEVEEVLRPACLVLAIEQQEQVEVAAGRAVKAVKAVEAVAAAGAPLEYIFTIMGPMGVS